MAPWLSEVARKISGLLDSGSRIGHLVWASMFTVFLLGAALLARRNLRLNLNSNHHKMRIGYTPSCGGVFGYLEQHNTC